MFQRPVATHVDLYIYTLCPHSTSSYTVLDRPERITLPSARAIHINLVSEDNAVFTKISNKNSLVLHTLFRLIDQSEQWRRSAVTSLRLGCLSCCGRIASGVQAARNNRCRQHPKCNHTIVDKARMSPEAEGNFFPIGNALKLSFGAM